MKLNPMNSKKKWETPMVYLLADGSGNIEAKNIANPRETFWTKQSPAPNNEFFLWHSPGFNVTTVNKKSSFHS